MARTPTDPTKAQVWITKGIDDLDFEFYFPQGPKGDPGGFTTGTQLLANNLNAIKVAGLYRQDDYTQASSANNYPMPWVNGVLIVTSMAGTDYVLQQWTPIHGNSGSGRTIFIREFATPNWSPWRSFNSTRVDQTAGRAIYQWDDLNNREQLIYGDTGDRHLPALTGGLAGWIKLRRVGQSVTISIHGWVKYTGLKDIVDIPIGFRPTDDFQGIALVEDLTDIVHSARYTASTGKLSYYGEREPGNMLFGPSTWVTNDAWPSTLPGNAFGIIPNL